MISVTVFVLTALKIAQTARILGVVPTPSYSHQVAFRQIFAELSLRGHQVTVLTTDPMKNASLTNLTEIDLQGAYEDWRKHDLASFMLKNGHNPLTMVAKMDVVFKDLMDYEIYHPQVQELIHNETFDLVMIEMMFLHPFALVEVFQCPFIGIVSVDALPHFHKIMGNPDHPVLHPNQFSPVFGKLNFLDRLVSTIISVSIRLLNYRDSIKVTREIKQYFGETMPYIPEILDKITLMFLNLNPALNSVRPVSPSTILIGGSTHLEATKPLPAVLNSLI